MKVELQRARRNFDQWYGGVPRLVLERPSTEADESNDNVLAKDAINSTNIEQVLAAMQGQYDAGPEASHQVVHQDGDRVTFRPSEWKFATRLMGELFAQATSTHGTEARLLKTLAGPSNPNNSSRGHFFEALRHQFMCDGKVTRTYEIIDVQCDVPASGKPGKATAERRDSLSKAIEVASAKAREKSGIKAGQPLQMTLTKLEMNFFVGGLGEGIGNFASKANESSTPRFLWPDNAIHPVIDACIYPDTLLNFKVGNTAALNEQLLEDHLNCLPDLPVYYYDFYVPADKVSSFKPKALLRDKKHPRVNRTHVRLVVEAKLQPSFTNPKRSVRMHAQHGSLPKARFYV